ncbi:hypothetical protein ABPG77_001698 [Micractinium sp. CCAP 211/92]
MARDTNDEPLPSLARRLLATLVVICVNLAHEVSVQLEALRSGSGGTSGSSEGAQQHQQQDEQQWQQHAARIQAALAPLQRALRQSPDPNEMLQAVPAEALPQALTSFQEGLLPAATRMAEAAPGAVGRSSGAAGGAAAAGQGGGRAQLCIPALRQPGAGGRAGSRPGQGRQALQRLPRGPVLLHDLPAGRLARALGPQESLQSACSRAAAGAGRAAHIASLGCVMIAVLQPFPPPVPSNALQFTPGMQP